MEQTKLAPAPPADPAEGRSASAPTRPWLVPYRFPKGKSPNPGGKKKKKWLTGALEALLPQTIEAAPDLHPALKPFVGMTFAELFAAGLVMEAVTGNGVAAFREAADRSEGKKSIVELTGKVEVDSLVRAAYERARAGRDDR